MNKKLILSLLIAAVMSIHAKAQTLKQEEIKPLNNALETVTQLKPISFNYDKTWSEKLNLKVNQNGFDLAALEKTSPQLLINQQVSYTAGKNNTKTAVVQKIDYEALIPMLVSSIKDQQQQIEALKAELQALKSKSSK